MAPSGPSLPLLHPLSAAGGLGEPPKMQVGLCPLWAEGRPLPGHSKTELVVMSRKGHRPVIRHDKGGEEQSMTSARMEIMSTTAQGFWLPGYSITLPSRAQGRSSSWQFPLASIFSSLSFSSFLLVILFIYFNLLSFVFLFPLLWPFSMKHSCLFFSLSLLLPGSPLFAFSPCLPFHLLVSA